MGILSAGLKRTIKSSRSKSAEDFTPPKKDINPLLKQMEEAFLTSDAAEIETGPLGDSLRSEGEVVGRFYSPVYSAIEKMPIGKEGTKGENIMGYLNKRAPNVDKSEIESFNINLDPNKKYTREEVLTLAKEKGSPDYTIEKQKDTNYEDIQRQNVSDKEVDYIELTVQGKQDYTKSSTDTHLGGKRNIGHTRVSIRQEMPEGGPLSQKITDRPRYLLVEEFQSDLSKRRDDLTTEQPESTFFDNNLLPALNPDTDIEQFNREVYYPRISGNFDDLVEELNDLFNIYVDRNVVNTIKDFYSRTFNPELIDNADDVRKIFEDDTYKNQLIKELKDEHNIDVAGKDIETVSLDAIRKKSDTSSGETDFVDDGARELSPDEVLEGETKDALRRTKIFINNLYVNSSPKSKPKEIQTLPVATRSEYVKRLLLANIAYAKQNGINKIVIPNYKEIARQRTDDLEFVMYERPENDPLRKKYEQSLKEGTTDKLAQEYYEGVFKPIYEDAVKKVLNGLKAETKGAIKTSTKELKYPDLTKPDRFRKSNALEIDITEFDYDPATSIFRFAEGGAVPMEEQMKLFEEGGLRDEGGMVGEVSGNDVPIGSTRKEVRDDIPAMLSEGEFVFPADVVRYVGLEKLMKIRQNAKQGLKKMEEMGQMGNSDEATMPDDLPFGIMDLIIVEGEEEEPQKKAHGGVVHMQKGGFTVPKFDPRNQDVRQYENAEGKKLNIPFLGGKPVYPIPEGYFPVGTVIEEEKDETKEAIPTDDDDDPSGAGQVTNAFTEAGSWEGSPLDMYIKEAEKVSTFGNVAAGVMAATVPVLGAFVSLANKNQKKRILATIDARIEEAKKTDVPGQVAALREVKDRLTKDERKGILGGIVGEIIDGISGAIGLTPEETTAAKNVGGLNAGTDLKESDDKKLQLAVDESLRPVARPTPIPKPFEDQPPLSDKTPPSLTEITDFAKTTPSVEEQTQEALLPLDNTGEDTIRGAIPTDTAAVAAKPEQVTGGLGEVKTRAEDRQDFKLITANEELQNALRAIRSADATNLLMQKNKDAKNKGTEELLNQLTSSVANLVGRNKGRSDDPQAGPSNVPTAYETGQQRRGSTPSSSNNDDDGPNAAERHRQAVESIKKISESTPKVKTRTDKDSMVAAAEKAGGAAKSYADIAKEDNPFGLLNKGGLIKKGGLASRKK